MVKGGRTGERKTSRKKRITIKPDFLPQIPMPSTPALYELAKKENLELLYSMGQTGEKRKKKPEELAAQRIMRQRLDTSKKNTSKFYLNLFQALYGGKISKQNDAPLFPDEQIQVCSIPGFRPDLVISGELRETYVEIKSSSLKQKSWFAHKQFLSYSRALLENKGSEMLTAIFRYGKRENVKLYICNNKDGHKCNNRCLVDKLSNSTRNLLVIPHNLLTFLLMLCHSKDMSHVSSQGRNFENYKRPHGTWLTFFHDYWRNPDEAINKTLEYAESKDSDLMGFSREDFYLDDLEATQHDAPRIYCRNHRIGNNIGEKWKPFIITEYKTPYNTEWTSHFRDNLDSFLENLCMKDDYDKLQAWIERSNERQAIKTADTLRVPKEPTDGIPI